MANSTAKKTNTRRNTRTAAAKSTPTTSAKKEAQKNVDVGVRVAAPASEAHDTRSNTTVPISAKDVDMTQYITVKNGFQGKLVYKSAHTGETFIWDSFGDEQEMELRELKNAKNSNTAFFENNWFMFDDDDMWVVDFLGVNKYYDNAVSIDHFDDIFEMSPDDIRETVSKLSLGQKRSLAYRARQFVQDNMIDSRAVTSALEESLGIEITEK